MSKKEPENIELECIGCGSKFITSEDFKGQPVWCINCLEDKG